MTTSEFAESCACEAIHEDAVLAAKAALPEFEALEDLAEFFKVLTDPTRLAIMYALRVGELCVCDLSATTGGSSSTVSRHLSILKKAKLVASRRDGRVVFYRLADSHVQGIVAQAYEHLTE